MPGMIRLVVDIWLTSTSDASETRWRLAIPTSVSPQRTRMFPRLATGDEAVCWLTVLVLVMVMSRCW